MVDMRPPAASAAGHSFEDRRPSPPLAGLVSTVYVMQVSAAASPYTEVALPNGGVELRCRVGSLPDVVGPQTGPLPQLMEPGTTVIGIRFGAGAAAALLGLPASYLADLTVDSEELFGHSVRVAAERMAEAASPTAALALLEQMVLARRADAPDPDPLIQEIVGALMPWRGGNLASLRSKLGISERQLRRRCQSEVGLAPKVLHRTFAVPGLPGARPRVTGTS